jgi:predicted RNA-binding Zn-ribbon protein involved in translation (DUF1610 family)
MPRQWIDWVTLTWALKEAARQWAEPTTCDECDGELPVDEALTECPHCGADLIPF